VPDFVFTVGTYGTPANLRLFSAQICGQNSGNPQVSATRPSQTRDREPSQVRVADLRAGTEAARGLPDGARRVNGDPARAGCPGPGTPPGWCHRPLDQARALEAAPVAVAPATGAAADRQICTHYLRPPTARRDRAGAGS
jgi:hypothetical protein